MLFIAYMGGISFFTHTHIINGVTIVHSHPYKSDSNHEHNTAEFELIAHLNAVHLPASLGLLFLFTAFLIPLRSLSVFNPSNGYAENQYVSLSPRAPPAC